MIVEATEECRARGRMSKPRKNVEHMEECRAYGRMSKPWKNVKMSGVSAYRYGEIVVINPSLMGMTVG
jgi:hypothetical protein